MPRPKSRLIDPRRAGVVAQVAGGFRPDRATIVTPSAGTDDAAGGRTPGTPTSATVDVLLRAGGTRPDEQSWAARLTPTTLWVIVADVDVAVSTSSTITIGSRSFAVVGVIVESDAYEQRIICAEVH